MSYIKHRVGDTVNGIKCVELAGRKCDRQQYVFQCPYCENTFITFMYNVTSGHAKSCGCKRVEFMVEKTTKHGHCKGGTHTSEYGSYREMMDRCYNPKSDEYKNYGARGIYVCDRWKESFSNFIEDMGLKPGKNYSIERIDNDGIYELVNCKWATNVEQSQNQRRTMRVMYNGDIVAMASVFQHGSRAYYSIRHARKYGLMQERFDMEVWVRDISHSKMCA